MGHQLWRGVSRTLTWPRKVERNRQFALDIFAGTIPVDQGLDGETLAQVMNPWTVALPLLPKADLSRQLPEDAVHILVQQSAALLGDKE